jgi:pimeloyl-ACP methyl ester carboxylesterase
VCVKVIDVGSGAPVVLVPGDLGRWEWMKPAVDALSTRGRVVTFSLADEPTSGAPFDAARGFDSYVRQVADAMDAAGLPHATICGISYGGLIAAAFAARHRDRTSALVLASAIPPSWRPDRRAAFLMRAPTLLSPLFCVGSLRLFPEMAAARRGLLPGLTFAVRHVATVLTHPFSPSRMARRVRLLEGLDLARELVGVHLPTLVVTGEPGLDRVVPVRATRDYLALWPHATSKTISRTGHLGPITRPDAFADLVAGCAVQASSTDEDLRRRVV